MFNVLDEPSRGKKEGYFPYWRGVNAGSKAGFRGEDGELNEGYDAFIFKRHAGHREGEQSFALSCQQTKNIKRAHGRVEPCAHYSIFQKYKSVHEDIGYSRAIPHSLNFFFLNQSV